MDLYRFSPIRQESELVEALQYIHKTCAQLCADAVGQTLPTSGNLCFFCHYPAEYEGLQKVQQGLTLGGGKYQILKKPLVFDGMNYTHLCIRQPDPYRSQVGCVDYLMPQPDYDALKAELLGGKEIVGVRVFPRDDLDMLELYHPDVDVLGYITTSRL